MQSPFMHPQYAWQNAREHTAPKKYVYDVKKNHQDTLK